MDNRILSALDISVTAKGHFPSLLQGGNCEEGEGESHEVFSPCDGASLGLFNLLSEAQVSDAIVRAREAFLKQRLIPAPRRGEFVRELGNEFRANKQQLAELITLECGKILQESLGEVQEVIDICDLAVGLSRQLHGLTIASERPEHRMMEQWHPLGPIAVISAFNFPMAVWAWNATLAIVCGNTLLWKPSEKAPLCALACQQLVNRVLTRFEEFPQDLSAVLVGDRRTGEQLSHCREIPLISATGSVAMGRKVGASVGSRLGRSLLELGGNNGMIVTPSANLELALRAIVFSAVGTCGQRCTSLRRVIAQQEIIGPLEQRLLASYDTLPIGDPFDSVTLVGPLIDGHAYKQMQRALVDAEAEGGKLLCGGERVTVSGGEGGFYVKPAIIRIGPEAEIVKEETFAPILYLIPYSDFEEAIRIHNNVPQGLSSAIFTDDLKESEHFLSVTGSDCGLANVNIGTSGAEIGGAFGGEKDTGGGRESGSDAWKNYMRRATNTINYGDDIPLAQGIDFGT
ncbi:MAG: aldehyde dehydrogenase family protein [Candidatus Sedimenticola sp. (ex Thyasira tokunagai)]